MNLAEQSSHFSLSERVQFSSDSAEPSLSASVLLASSWPAFFLSLLPNLSLSSSPDKRGCLWSCSCSPSRSGAVLPSCCSPNGGHQQRLGYFGFSGVTEIHSSQLSNRAFTEEPSGAHRIDCKPETGTWRQSDTKVARDQRRGAPQFHSKKAWTEGLCPQLVSVPVPLLESQIPRESVCQSGLGRACAWLGKQGNRL